MNFSFTTTETIFTNDIFTVDFLQIIGDNISPWIQYHRFVLWIGRETFYYQFMLRADCEDSSLEPEISNV